VPDLELPQRVGEGVVRGHHDAGCGLSTGQFSSVIEVQVQEAKKYHYLPKFPVGMVPC
jgi:hypothetical protein